MVPWCFWVQPIRPKKFLAYQPLEVVFSMACWRWILFFFPKQVAFKKFAARKWGPEPERYKMEPYFTPPPKKWPEKDMGLPVFFFTQRWRKNSPEFQLIFFWAPSPGTPESFGCDWICQELENPTRSPSFLVGKRSQWLVHRPFKKMIEAKQHIAAYSISTRMMYKNNDKYTKHV